MSKAQIPESTLLPIPASVPTVIANALLKFRRAKKLVASAYTDGNTYSDGYDDTHYGDYSDHEDPDPTED